MHKYASLSAYIAVQCTAYREEEGERKWDGRQVDISAHFRVGGGGPCFTVDKYFQALGFRVALDSLRFILAVKELVNKGRDDSNCAYEASLRQCYGTLMQPVAYNIHVDQVRYSTCSCRTRFLMDNFRRRTAELIFR